MGPCASQGRRKSFPIQFSKPNTPSPSRGAFRPRFTIHLALSLNQRAQGRPGACCTRGLACDLRKQKCTRAYRAAAAFRPSLRNGFTAYSALSPVNGSFATVVAQKKNPLKNLTPAPRRQDHTTSPYASGAYVLRAIRVHRISPHVRDDRERPSIG